jgi:hypothetical protein
MLELDDIQALLLTQGLVLCGRYSFLTFRDPGAGRVFLSRVVHEVSSAETASMSPASYVYLGLTCNGLRALGVDEASLATFPEAFRAGMPARAQELGDHGASHPGHWVGGLASPDLHALLLLFAQDPAERARRTGEHRSLLGSSPGVGVLSELDVDLPATFREHFGYQDGITTVCVEGTGIEPPPGSGPRRQARRVRAGLPRRDGLRPDPSPAGVAHPQRQLSGLPAALPGCRRLPAIPAGARCHA